MKLAFYKASGDMFDKLVRWWTSGKYSHCELVFSDGWFFSSSPRDGGARFKFIEQSSEDWDFVELNTSIEFEAIVKRWCRANEGRKYDWYGILFSQILPLDANDPGRYFCSEICITALKQIGKLIRLDANEENPSSLARMFGL